MSETIPRRARSIRVESVVLRHSEWGEADRFVTLYTLEMGKLRALAKGVRRPRSRKAGHLEPFNHANLLLAKGREIWLITQAETINSFSSMLDNLMLTTYAAYVVELLDRFTYEEGENRAIYRLLVDTLGRLNQLGSYQTSETRADLVVRYFEMRLLDYLGFRPQLFQCANCNTTILAEDQFFSAEAGGVLCPICGPKAAIVRPVSVLALKYMRHFQRSSFNEALRASPAIITSREFESLMQYYLTYLLERGLNTPAFLRRLRQERAGNEGA